MNVMIEYIYMSMTEICVEWLSYKYALYLCEFVPLNERMLDSAEQLKSCKV
jgi:hypothetical protein